MEKKKTEAIESAPALCIMAFAPQGCPVPEVLLQVLFKSFMAKLVEAGFKARSIETGTLAHVRQRAQMLVDASVTRESWSAHHKRNIGAENAAGEAKIKNSKIDIIDTARGINLKES